MQARAVLSFVATALAIAACAGPEDFASETSTLADYCKTRARVECSAALVNACGAKDADTCVADRQAACMKAVPQGTVYVPAAGPACIVAVQAAYTTTTLTADAIASVDTACEPIFSGPGAARSPCTVDYDCSTKDGLRCLIAPEQTQGKCLAPNMIDPGGTCPGEADVCSGPYYCDVQSKVCVAEGGEGAACQPDSAPCMQGYRCPGGLFGSTCMPLKVSGDACTADSDCQSNLCDKAAGQAQGTCADQIQLTALDSMCADYR